MQVTVLIDNNSESELLCEWGLSFLIDTDGSRILLDFGASGKFAQNAAALGINLATVDCAVLSHAHYDHGGGIPTFLDLNSNAPIYIAAEAEEDCWAKGRSHSGKGLLSALFEQRYIGLPYGTIEKAGARLHRVPYAMQLGEHAWIVPHCGNADAGSRQKLYRKRNGKLRTDDLKHEMSLVCECEDGLVVLNSCSHTGPETILADVRKHFPDKKIHAYIGGLHLYKTGKRGILKVAETFKTSCLEYLFTGHCTGDKAFGILNGSVNATQLHSGLRIDFPIAGK